MIWMYTVTGVNEILARDVASLEEVETLRREADLVWMDFVEPDKKELEVFAGAR